MSTTTTTALPARTLHQRRLALRLANDVRIARAKLKEDLTAGTRDVHDLLDRPPIYAANMHVTEALLALPKWGDVKVGKALDTAQISQHKTIGGLNWNQRERLHRALNGAARR